MYHLETLWTIGVDFDVNNTVEQSGEADLWGEKTGFNEFDDFMYKNIVPACFRAPMKPTLDLRDAQTILAINKAAACLKYVADKKGNEFLLYLQTSYLPTFNLSPILIQEFCEALKSEPKVFRNYFNAFIVKAKS